MKTSHEKKLLEELKYLGGRVRFYHDGTHDGRRQSVALVKIADKYYQGYATLSDKDKFDRNIGRVISLGRAFKNYKDGISMVPEDAEIFRED